MRVRVVFPAHNLRLQALCVTICMRLTHQCHCQLESIHWPLVLKKLKLLCARKNAASCCSSGLIPAGGGGGGGGRDSSRHVLTRDWASGALLLQYSESKHQVGNFQAQPCLLMFFGFTHIGSSQQSVIFAGLKIVAKLQRSLARQRAVHASGGSPP